MNKWWLGTLVALAGATAVAADANPVVAYRELLMSSMSKHMKMAGMIAKGEISRPTDLLAHATALRDAANELGALFPAGTGPDKVKSEASPAIWAKPDAFAAAIAAYTNETTALVEVAKGGDVAAFAAQLQRVGGTCGGCHESFKAD